ncbi:MAG: hypothetical protein ACKPE2_11100, partial [Dolichospermum sp.]
KRSHETHNHTMSNLNLIKSHHKHMLVQLLVTSKFIKLSICTLSTLRQLETKPPSKISLTLVRKVLKMGKRIGLAVENKFVQLSLIKIFSN